MAKTTEQKNNRTLPEGVTPAMLSANWDEASRQYLRAHRRAQLLDAADRGRLWETLRARRMPGYQILPDTNHVAYVKDNLVASIYSVGKSADLLATTKEDRDLVTQLNLTLDYYWNICSVPKYQMQAGDRAALMNLGITQVGWSEEVVNGGEPGQNGVPVLKNIDPIRFMRDPYADSLDTSGYCMTWEFVHINVLKANKLYAAAMVDYDATRTNMTSVAVEQLRDRPMESEAQSSPNNVRLIIHWLRLPNGDYAEIHTLNNTYILFVKPKILPAMYPFSLLYCNLPNGDLIGTSAPAKVYANSVAYNLFNSILMTSEYKNQRPPKFLDTTSGLNAVSFIEHGNDADYTFLVNGDASKAVHYASFPTASPAAQSLMQNLPVDVQMVSGVDGRYTGRQTGSILTTGGIEAMLDQVTLIDAPKINNYENYTLRLTKLILSNLLTFAPKRSYFLRIPNKAAYKDVTVDFPKIRNKEAVFAYQINISSMLPKTRARIAQTANTLMEKQMQYQQAGQRVDLMTPEEWLACQDIPMKEQMLERMGLQRSTDYLDKVAQTLYTYTELVKNGVDPRAAIEQTAQMMQMQDTPGMNPMDVPVDPLAQNSDVPIT